MPARPSTHGRDLRRQSLAIRESRPERKLYDRSWAGYSRTFREQHPLCADPFGVHAVEERAELSAVVDHIKPHKGNREAFWDPANHQALCKSCHDRKTATKDGGFGR